MAKKSRKGDLADIEHIIRERLGNVKNNVVRATARATQIVQKEAVDKISSGGRSGRQDLKKSGKIHTASAPGEYPKTDDGELIRSIFTNIETKGSVVVGQIICDAAHGAPLEFGTMHMDPRPFMQPSLDSKSGEIFQIYAQEGYLKTTRGGGVN